MNRRKLLSLIGATALTPIIPPQVFASGGIVNPDRCGFIGEMASDFVIPKPMADEWRSIGTISAVRRDGENMVFNIIMHGDGTDRKSGLI